MRTTHDMNKKIVNLLKIDGTDPVKAYAALRISELEKALIRFGKLEEPCGRYYRVLLFLTQENLVFDDFAFGAEDRYDLALRVAQENGRDEPTELDGVEGFCRLCEEIMDGYRSGIEDVDEEDCDDQSWE